jgi:hypothetical protein
MISLLERLNFTRESISLNERLKLNTDSKINNRNNWSILNAKPGDLVQCVGYKIFFMYKGLVKHDDKDNIIEYYWLVDLSDNGKRLKDKSDWGVGTTDDPNEFKLVTTEDEKKVYNYLKQKGYYWDKIKLELKRL